MHQHAQYWIPALESIDHVIVVTRSGDILVAFTDPAMWGGEPVRLDTLPPGAEVLQSLGVPDLGEPVADVTWADVLDRLCLDAQAAEGA